MEYVFRPMASGDLAMVRRWLETAEVVRWWVRPDEQYQLVRDDLDHPDMDQFIGVSDMIGRGHGSSFIRQFVDGLLTPGTPRVVADPDPDNRRAVRAYEKAGFENERMVDTPDGPALLMVRNR
jgi:aminoglycoside 6'-N-acetyltransferase